MEVHTLGYDRKKLWSVRSRPRIDSRRTLVLLFGSSSLLDSADPLGELISCVGCRLVLGERTEEETEATLDVLPKGTQQIRCYSYGEISPYTAETCDLHNQTMTFTTLSEAA